MWLIRSRNGDAIVAGDFWAVIASAFVVLSADGVIGALVHNQIAVVVGYWMTRHRVHHPSARSQGSDAG